MDQTASWLKDGVVEIERIAKASMIVEPKIISIPQEKPGTYGIVTPGPAGEANKIDVRVAGPLWHNERLDDPNQLIAFIKSMDGRGVKPEAGAVYISESSITHVYDFEDRRHRATCPLTLSDQWKWLSAKQGHLDQRTLIRVLRILFDGALGPDSNLIGVVRNVKWKSQGEMEANIQRGKEALGRQILNEAAGIADFPDEFVVTVQVYENFNQKVSVRLALEVLPDVQKFEVIPFPNEIHNGMAETLGWLQDQIAATKVPTFIGAVSGGKQAGE